MITNEIYFFKNQSSASTSDSLYNVNDGTLILQVDGDVSDLELLVLGNTDLVDDGFVALKTINASDYSINGKITSTGIYWIDINGIRKIKLNLSKITGSVNVKALTKRGLTTDLVARAMAANASGGGSYTLPVASASTLGGIKVGENLTITEDGTLSAAGSNSEVTTVDGTVYTQNNPYILDYDGINFGELFIFKNEPYIKLKKDGLISEKSAQSVARRFDNILCMVCTKSIGKSDAGIRFQAINNTKYVPLNDEIIFHGYLTLVLAKDDAQVYYISYSDTEKITEYERLTTYMRNYDSYNISGKFTYTTLPKSSITPTEADQFTRKGYVDTVPTTYAGYDATKTQVLKNINGTLTWVTEE